MVVVILTTLLQHMTLVGSSQDVPKMNIATNPKHLSVTETFKESINTCSTDELNLDAKRDVPRNSSAIPKRKNPINNVTSKRFKTCF